MTLLAEPPAIDLVSAAGIDPATVVIGPDGVVYLLHFSRLYVPYPGAPAGSCAGHYLGWTTGLVERLRLHEAGQGARLTAHVASVGITWTLVRVWQGGPKRERQLKNMGGARRSCPVCGIVPRAERQRHRGPDGRYISPTEEAPCPR